MSEKERPPRSRDEGSVTPERTDDDDHGAGLIGQAIPDVDGTEPRPRKCPRCESPQPHLHPSIQWEGEVQPCPHPWHQVGSARPCVCQIEDGLVREWVQKAQAVARAKGYQVASQPVREERQQKNDDQSRPPSLSPGGRDADQAATETEMLREALSGLVDAVTPEVNEKGAGGFLLARLADAREAIKKAGTR